MAVVRYYAVCKECGKRGTSTTRSEQSGPPSITPPVMSGPCPCTDDKKHRPCWVKG